MNNDQERFLRRMLAGGLVLWLAAAVAELTLGRSLPFAGFFALRLVLGLGAAAMSYGFFRLFARRMEHNPELPVFLRQPLARFFRGASVLFALFAVLAPLVPLLKRVGATPIKGLTP